MLRINRNKKKLGAILEHKLEEAKLDNMQRDVQLGQFIVLSVVVTH